MTSGAVERSSQERPAQVQPAQMQPAQVPRSSSELLTESLGLSPKQRVVLNALHEFPQGAKIS